MKQSLRDQTNLPFAAVVGAIVTIIALTLLIVWADLMPTVKDWLKATFSHHWVGKGVIAVIIFFVSGLIASAGQPKTDDQLAGAVKRLFVTSMVGMSILTVFFFYEAFLK